MNRLFIVAAACAALAACGSTPKPAPIPAVSTQEVVVEVSRPCPVEEPAAEAYPADVSPLDQGIWEQVVTLLNDRDARKAKEAELRAALRGCKGGAK